jgi:filamin
LCDEEDIPKSPYMAQIIVQPPEVFPKKVKVSGMGVDSARIGRTSNFTINHKNAGVAPMKVKVNDSTGKAVPVQIAEKRDGVKQVYYTPSNSKPHIVEVSYGGFGVPDSPFRVYVKAPLDSTKVQVSGPWAENHPDIKPTHFIVDAR